MTAQSIILIGQGLTGGGAELSMLRLAENFIARGYDVRVAVLKRKGRLLDMLPPGLVVDEIGGGRLGCIPRLARYLRRHRPDAVISFMTYTNVVAILAQALSPSLRRIVVSEHSAYSKSIHIRGGVVKLIYHMVPFAYRWTRQVVCVSRGVEVDLIAATRLPRKRLTTVYNPVISDALLARSTEPPDHPWLKSKDLPVILAVGRLDRPKNYPLLLEAVARLHQRLPCRLIILGEGELRDRIEAEIARLGLKDCVDLAGFRADAISFMRAADVVALSSDWEGLSNVLIEALAVGCPVVSTDAPHGPREVLADGRFGHLVPVGDADAFADALEASIRKPGDAAQRIAWGRSFSVDACALRYLEIAGLGQPGQRGPVAAPITATLGEH